MENLWGMIAKARGVELNEEFLVSWGNLKDRYRITESGLYFYSDGKWCHSSCIDEFIKGIVEVERLPFRPKSVEVYYTIMHNTAVGSFHWADTGTDYQRLIAGLVFRTREEAEAYIPVWLERISKL